MKLRWNGPVETMVLAGLEQARSRGLTRVLAGLGIRHIGATAAKTLARHFPHDMRRLHQTTVLVE